MDRRDFWQQSLWLFYYLRCYRGDGFQRLYVAAVGGSGQGAATGTISAVAFSGCATASLTLIDDSGDDTSGWDSALYGGTVSGISGACTVTGTYSAAGAFQTFAIALGTLSNLDFTTPGTACKGGYAASQNSPFPVPRASPSLVAASVLSEFPDQNSAITSIILRSRPRLIANKMSGRPVRRQVWL